MSRKPTYGVCKLCGGRKKLTFEHVPPESTFNSQCVKVISGETLLDTIGNSDKLPWEIEKERGKFQQRGRGGYYLCEDCNSKTGQWYVPSYSEFVHGIHHVTQQLDENYKVAKIFAPKIRPLPIFKQIMTMFCDINDEGFCDESMKRFLLNKSNNDFDKTKYNLYMYIHSGQIERISGVMVKITLGEGVVLLSEICVYPVGFALYINKPKNYIPIGVEITSFCDYKYDECVDGLLVVPKLESNIIYPGDYRTKHDIISCIERNREWEKNNRIE